MRSLIVTTPASDTALLTITEMRVAAGFVSTDASKDTELLALGARVAASITSECNIAAGIGGIPTLRRETLTETIYAPFGNELMLSRRHEVSLTSVTLDGSLLSASDYVTDAESGFVVCLTSGAITPRTWSGTVALVVYQAGFSTVPGDLKQAAIDCFRAMYLEGSRDPMLKSISQDIPGVMSESKDFWVGVVPGNGHEGAVPAVVAGQLKRFRNLAVA